MSAMHGITNFKSNYVFIIARARGTDHKLVESWHGQLLSTAFFAGSAVHNAEKCGLARPMLEGRGVSPGLRTGDAAS